MIVVGTACLQVKNLEDVVLRFTLGDGDILLATSIIENGIDMPNVNSIIIMVRPGRPLQSISVVSVRFQALP